MIYFYDYLYDYPNDYFISMYNIMPKGNPYFRRKRFRRPGKYAHLSRPMKNSVKYLIKKHEAQEVEYKHAIFGVGQQEFYTGGGVGLVLDNLTDAITQNITDSTRVGDQLKIRDIAVRVLLRNAVSATSNEFTLARVTVFQYKTANPATAADITNMFVTSSICAGVVGSASFLNPDYKHNYIILYDKFVLMTMGNPAAAGPAGTSGNIVKYLNFKVPLKYCKTKIQYVAAGNTLTNPIYLLIQSNSGDPGNSCTCAYDYDITFTDS